MFCVSDFIFEEKEKCEKMILFILFKLDIHGEMHLHSSSLHITTMMKFLCRVPWHTRFLIGRFYLSI